MVKRKLKHQFLQVYIYLKEHHIESALCLLPPEAYDQCMIANMISA